jgi:hypothetical protein
MTDLEWLDQFSGETVEQLLSLQRKYRIDSLVLAFEQALNQKLAREGEATLTREERVILDVEALEREVNNGGYSQFLGNAPESVATIVDSLLRIGCPKIAGLTQKALDAVGTPSLNTADISSLLKTPDQQRDNALTQCDDAYFEAPERIETQLFSFIVANKTAISF